MYLSCGFNTGSNPLQKSKRKIQGDCEMINDWRKNKKQNSGTQKKKTWAQMQDDRDSVTVQQFTFICGSCQERLWNVTSSPKQSVFVSSQKPNYRKRLVYSSTVFLFVFIIRMWFSSLKIIFWNEAYRSLMSEFPSVWKSDPESEREEEDVNGGSRKQFWISTKLWPEGKRMKHPLWVRLFTAT